MDKEKFELKIALNELGGAQWTGGVTYRKNLVKALQVLNPDQKLFLLTKEQKPDKDMEHLEMIRVKNASGMLEKLAERLYRKFLNKDFILEKALRGKSVDVLFPHAFNVGKKRASIYWIPDFQFVHLPQLYTATQLKHNQVKLNNYFKNADRIVVSSRDAYQDFEKFSPQYLDKVRIMRFVAHVPEDLYDDNPEEVSTVYNLPSEFIYMPNQFWAHKNHLLVLEALAILKQRGIRPFIVCSGNPLDVRDPMHLAKLLQKTSELGLRDQIALLGLIPHKHVYWLIRQSKCVLNPSLFEGWSTSVEESKSVGKRMVLSDLNVHFEQNPPDSLYFNRYDAHDFADKLETAWKTFASGPDQKLEETARAQIHNRMKEFASTFLDVCLEASALKS